MAMWQQRGSNAFRLQAVICAAFGLGIEPIEELEVTLSNT